MRLKPHLILLFQVLLLFSEANSNLFAQTASYPYNEWVKKLDSDNDTLQKDYDSVSAFFGRLSRPLVAPILNELEKKGATAGTYFQVRFAMLKSTMIWMVRKFDTRDSVAESITQLMKPAILKTYEINDEWLIAYASWKYSRMMLTCNKIEPAAMYGLNALEIFDKKKGIDALIYQQLADIFYATRDYEKSKYCLHKAIENEKDNPPPRPIAIISRWNTIALCWQKMGMYDSAFYYYDKAMQVADKENVEVWKGIISGNRGQIYYLKKNYDSSKLLLELDYRISQKNGEFAGAANSLQWLARVNLKLGKKDTALKQVREAMQMIRRQPRIGAAYLENLYYAAADVFRAVNNNDSFYHYSQLYSQVHDSTERVVATSRLEIAGLRLSNQDNIFKIRELQKEKQAQALQRNFIIIAIILCAAFALLILNRQRLKLRYQQQLALQQKAAAEKEVETAKEQLNSFTQNLIEKTSLIERLEQQIANKTHSIEQQQLIHELSRQTILTEEDWEKFKTLFETIYPGFFRNLKEKVSDITVAEQRMAAFSRLHLSINQIASILGISPNSVYKTRQRLRQRLNLDPEKNIEELLANI